MYEAEKNFFQEMEKSIEKLPKEQQAAIFRPCAEKCACGEVLKEQKRIFEKYNGDMDKIYSECEDNEFCYRRVVEKGYIYEMGYPRCLCYMYDSGFAVSPVHCECSRQSILYVLKELTPEKKYKVETIQTVIGGADKCLFRITVE